MNDCSVNLTDMKISFYTPALLIAIVSISMGETVKDREGAVRKDKETMQGDALWLYNDYEKGFAEARRVGKPLLVVLRCVPCLSCMGLDAGVLSSAELKPLLEKFVCVRLINANAIDLAKFQFDYDLSLSALIFNPDGTIYGRYGSWTHQKDPAEKTTAGFKLALESALKVHAGYPQNRAGLVGKQGGPTPFKTPIEIPSLAGRYKRDLDWDGKVVASCVHCHQIGDAYRNFYRSQSKPIPSEFIYPMPMPETIGLTLAPDQKARVQSVAAGSIANKNGVRTGDEFITLNGQLLFSIADFAWALHRAPESGTIPAKILRGKVEQQINLTLPVSWREKTDISKRVGTWGMRGMATGGLVLGDIADEDRAKRGLANDSLALLVKFVGQYNQHAAAKNAGFQKDYVILEIDGRSARLTEGQFIGQLLQTTKPGQKLKAIVLRGDKRLTLSLPMQ